MREFVSDVAFTPAVKALQEQHGSRAAYAKMEQKGGWSDRVTPELAAFVAQRNSFYLATASAAGQPYIQHRGGPKGFLRVLDEKTLAFADFTGNQQYITAGNLSENDRAYIFMMDYAERRRVKVWGRARVVRDDPDLLVSLMPPGYRAQPFQAILFTVEAWNTNCHQHIPRKFDEDDVIALVERLQARIAELEARLGDRGASVPTTESRAG